VVRSTEEKSRVKARNVAPELTQNIPSRQQATPREYCFKYHATRFIEKVRRLVDTCERNANHIFKFIFASFRY
jgi:hypothetical protein